MKKFMLYFLVTGLFCLAFIVILTQKPKEAIENTLPEQTVDARQFHAEFYRDEAGANEKYLNKIVAVTGEVSEVKKGDRGSFIVFLSSGDPQASVKCLLDTQKGQRKEFHVGEKVTFKCVCTGYLSQVELVQCVEW